MRTILFFFLLSSLSQAQDWVYLGEYDTGEKEIVSVWYDNESIEFIEDSVDESLLETFLIKYKSSHLHLDKFYNQKIIEVLIDIPKKLFYFRRSRLFLNDELQYTFGLSEMPISPYNISSNVFIHDFLIKLLNNLKGNNALN